MKLKDLRRHLSDVDRPDALACARKSASFRAALKMSRPPNWWGTGLNPRALINIARNEGIPVVWLPRSNILKELAAAASARERLELLVDRHDDLLADCIALCDEADDEWVSNECALLRRAIDACRAGFHEAGMALAVSIGEPMALWASTPRVSTFESEVQAEEWARQRKRRSKYLWVSDELALMPSLSALQVPRRALIAPIEGFFRPFRADATEPMPDDLCRHVVAHSANAAHFSRANALRALMLVASLLREMQSWCEEVRLNDANR